MDTGGKHNKMTGNYNRMNNSYARITWFRFIGYNLSHQGTPLSPAKIQKFPITTHHTQLISIEKFLNKDKSQEYKKRGCIAHCGTPSSLLSKLF